MILVQKKKTGEMFAAKCVSENLFKNNNDKNEPNHMARRQLFKSKLGLLIRLKTGKSDQTSEEPYALLGE